MAYPVMLQVDIRFEFLIFGEQCGANIICVEDGYPPFSTPLRNNLSLFLDEAPKVGERDLHTLVDDLTN